MKIYYVIYFQELIPCFLIKEGYIPCKDYKSNPLDSYYAAYSREQFCIASPDSLKNIFIDKNDGIKELKIIIEQKYQEGLKYLIHNKNHNLKLLENVS